MSSNICKKMQFLEAAGLNTGSAGNISVKAEDVILITPTGLSAGDLNSDKIVPLSLSGDWTGNWKPSSEWRIHTEIYAGFPDIGAVIHLHSPYATALSCHGRDLPAFHYMVAGIGGDNIRCAPYETFGTEELSKVVFSALKDRLACLMANHGMLAVGLTLDRAVDTALLVEELCKQYILSKILGEPNLISDKEMRHVLEKFKNYGNQNV